MSISVDARTVAGSAEKRRETRHIAYGGLPRQKLDLYVPQSGAVKATILFLYGGGWVSGARWYYRLFGRMMAGRGYAVVVPDYHLYPHARFPSFVEDAALAFNWTREHVRSWDGDPARVFVMGHSAGAHIAALIALDPKYLGAQGLDPSMIRGVIALAGPYTLNPLKWPGVRDIFASSAEAPHGARPIKMARAGAPPMLLLHGVKDRVVKSDASIFFADALTKAGSVATAKIYPRIGHFEVFGSYLWGLRWRASALADTEAFIEERLKEPSASA